MAKIKSIHTLNARGNIMLEVMRDYFNLTPTHMFREIQGMRQAVENALSKKGISYDSLRSALVPAQDRREIALVFDTTKINDSWYGRNVMQQIIPLFQRKANYSVLVGDYLDRSGQREHLYKAFCESVKPRKTIEFHHPSQFFIVYVNNLTDEMIKKFDEGLINYLAYVGIADMTYESAFKTYLSTMLVNSFVKNGSTIIQGHESDRDPEEDININGYPFEENGYSCRSISDDLMGVLLSYKIERPIYPGFEIDTEFSLNSIGLTSTNLKIFEIEVAEAKLEYLKKEKSGSIARAGLEAITIEDLAALIKKKIKDDYIYNMCFLEEHGVTKFNIIIELPKTMKSLQSSSVRLLAALACEPQRKTLRLLTLF